MKKIISLVLLIIILAFIFTGCDKPTINETDGLSIVTTIFPYYDFVKEIAGDKAKVEMLIPTGAETHGYEPSPQDIIKINEADIFIYNGGESDKWVETILSSLDNKVKTLCMFDYITPLCADNDHQHEHNEHSENDDHHHGDFDEHIWTSPINAINFSKAISKEIVSVDSINKSYYKTNTDKFIHKLHQLDDKIRKTVNQSDNKTLVIADRFPMLYFTQEYGLKYKSAFSGCSSETQPSIATVTELIDFVNEHKIPVIFHIDNSNANFATIVAQDTNSDVGTLYSCHNVTKEQFNQGVSYLSLMQLNLTALKGAL